MADQDFKINIVTLADLTGIRLTQEQLSALQTAAANGNKEAIAALKKLEQAQNEAARSARQQAEAQVQGIRAAAGYGLVLGGIVAKAINDVATEQERVTKELDKQGASLVKNVKLWQQLAEGATTAGDLSSVGEKALSQIDQIQDKFKEANSETLSLGQTVIDTLVAGFKNAFTFGGDPNAQGPFAALQDEKIKGLMQDLANAQENAARTVKRRLDEQRDTHEDIDQVIARETAHLSQQQALLRNLDPKTQLQSWVAVEQTVDRITKKIEQLNQQRQKQVEAGQPTTKAGLLGQQEQQLQALLDSRRLTPSEQNAVGQQLIKTHTERLQAEQKDRIDAFNKDIDDRNRRFTGGVSTGVPITPGVSPIAGVPGVPTAGFPGGMDQSTIQINQQILTTLQSILDLFR